MIERNQQLVVAASFTADQILETLAHWTTTLDASFTPKLAPYGQIHQELLSPTSLIRMNNNGANVICLRWQDMVGEHHTATTYSAAANELSQIFSSVPLHTPLLLVLCPQREYNELAMGSNEQIMAATTSMPNIEICMAQDSLTLYDVAETFDPDADSAGHIPYTMDAMTAIGTKITRWFLAQNRAPIKIIAADCDNTLWQGIVGEDSTDGITLNDGHISLQKKLKHQGEQGRLVTLLSKNEAQDVWQVFDQHTDMLLTRDDIIASTINWHPKPENLIGMTQDLNLGLDSVLFLDDNPTEIEAMRQFCPTVQSVRIPTDENALKKFVDHLWLFDQPKLTAEDIQRTQMYKESTARDIAQKSAVSLSSFLNSLNLEIDISPVTNDTIQRFSQLTMRTNQFNASMLRLSETEAHQSLSDGQFMRTIQAKDRFGDYGIVGALRAFKQGNILVTDIFLLSCRALSKGIEHKMINALGEYAAEKGCASVDIIFNKGQRNTPIAAFLNSIDPRKELFEKDKRLSLETEYSRYVSLSDEGSVAISNSAKQGEDPAPAGEHMSLDYQLIAERFTTAAEIVAEMNGKIAPRPALDTSYVMPASGMQTQIASIWQKVLRIEQIGSRDSFSALGGKSIQLVAVYGLLKRELKISFDLTLLFEHATIETLAIALEKISAGQGVSFTNRGNKMRAARAQRRAYRR